MRLFLKRLSTTTITGYELALTDSIAIPCRTTGRTLGPAFKAVFSDVCILTNRI